VKTKVKSIYIILFLMLLMLCCYFMDAFVVIENSIYDSFLETDAEQEISKDIVIVGIDDISYKNIGRWPFSRDIQAQIFNNILKDNPAVLGIDVLYDSKTQAESDNMLIDSIKNRNVVCAIEHVESYEKWGHKQDVNRIIAPFEELLAVCEVGYINPDPDESDGAVRKTILNKRFMDNVYNSFSYQIFLNYLENKSNELQKYNYDLNEPLYIDYLGKSKTYDYFSAYQVFNNDLPEGIFEGKIVLFGPYANAMQDEYITPTNRTEKMFGVEIHASIIQNLLENRFKVKASDSSVTVLIELMLIVVFCLIGYLVSKKFKPAIAFILTVGVIIVYIISAKIIYNNGLILQLFYPSLMIVVSYLVMLAYNYLEQLQEKKRITNIFGKYVAPQIVGKILEEGEESLKLGGNRRFVSVLFVDIRGFTPLSEKAEPEEVVAILNDYLDLCAKSIFNNGGTLDKFIGDATMAIYNAPLELEDHAFKAVKTAWEMKQGAEPLRKNIEERFGRTVSFGIGVNTGYAVVGNIGSKDRMDYTAIGDTVNTSARLESNAKPGQVLISQATYELVKDRVEVTSLGGIKVKGKAEELMVYQVEGVKE